MSIPALLFLAAFLAGCFFAFARHPIYGLMTYVAVFFLHPPSRWWGQGLLSYGRWAVMAAFVTLLAILLARKLKPPLIPMARHPAFVLYILFTLWLMVQTAWAMDPLEHRELLSYYLKFVIVFFLVYRCIDSDKHLVMVMWTFVAGCFYFGWIAYTTYEGGRFEGFGGPGTAEANAGALVCVTGVFTGSVLFLNSKSWRERAALIVMIPFILNALVTTGSRSGFLALTVGGIVFNYFTPKQHRKWVRRLSVIAVALFLSLAGGIFWSRMQTIEHAGADIEGVDTGGGRLEIIEAQWRMFKEYPLGCGATCTAVLSTQYIDAKFLTDSGMGGGPMVRASHNTFMTMLTEHGIPGATFYIMLLLWILSRVRRLGKAYQTEDHGMMAALLPGVAAVLLGITVGDMFVTHARLEVRIWFIGILMAMYNLMVARQQAAVPVPAAAEPVPPAKPSRVQVARRGAPGQAVPGRRR